MDLTKLPQGRVLESVPLKCGDTLTVSLNSSTSSPRDAQQTPASASAAPAASAAGRRPAQAPNASLPAHPPPPPAAKYPRRTVPRAPRDPRTTPSLLMRKRVPSNNSCLFLAVNYLLNNGDLNTDASDVRWLVIPNDLLEFSFQQFITVEYAVLVIPPSGAATEEGDCGGGALFARSLQRGLSRCVLCCASDSHDSNTMLRF